MPNWQGMTPEQRQEWQKIVRARETGRSTGGRGRRIIDAVKENGNPLRKHK